MDAHQIQAEVDDLLASCLALQMIKPFVQFDIESGKSEFSLYIRRELPEKQNFQFEWFYGHEPESTIEAARQWLLDHPTPEQQQLQSYMALVAKAVEFGKAKGFDTAMVNPLEAVMKKLSENALTYRPSPTPPSAPADDDDSIPF